MEYADLISKIVRAEHSAKELVHDARAREAHLQADLDQEVAQMRDTYLSRARHRLELVEQTERATAAENIAALDKRLADALAAVETSYEKNQAQWVDTLFGMIVGATP